MHLTKCAIRYNKQVHTASSSPSPLNQVLVLGHGGFIGRQLLAHLQAAFPSLPVLGRSSGEADLTLPDSHAALAPLFTPETAVIVCSGIKKQNGDTLETFELNLRMATTLSRLLAAHPVRRLLFLSSAEVYGEERRGMPVNESTPPAPRSYYGLAKYASEGLLRKVGEQIGIDPLLLRLPFVYGPGDRPGIYGPLEFLRAAVAGQPVTLWGDGSERREFLFAIDLARVIERLLPLSCGGVLNVVSGQGGSFRDAVDIIARMLARPVPIENRPRSKPQVDLDFDPRHLHELLPNFSFTSLADGLAHCLAAQSPHRP